MTPQPHPLDLIPAYALGVLDIEEAEILSAHLAHCESCQAELRAYEQVVAATPLAARETAPPPALKATILETIATTSSPAASPPTPSLWEQIVDTFRRPSPRFAGFALALILVLAAVNVFLWLQLQATPAIPQELQTVAMVGTSAASDAIGLVVFENDGNEGTLVVDGLAPLDASQQYQLWLIRDGERDNGGVFSVSDNGYGWLKIVSDIPLQTYSAFGITVEPAGGSPGPTGQKVMGSER